jgi:hypothetical protein
MTDRVREILSWHRSEKSGRADHLARLLTSKRKRPKVPQGIRPVDEYTEGEAGRGAQLSQGSV